jgi:hypothetical protein
MPFMVVRAREEGASRRGEADYTARARPKGAPTAEHTAQARSAIEHHRRAPQQ